MRLSDAIDDDRLHQHVNGYRIDVVEPLQELRLTLAETEGIAADLTLRGLFPAALERPHEMLIERRVTLQACRFAQVGTWEGWIEVDGERLTVEHDTSVASRDRSWGIRPIGGPGSNCAKNNGYRVMPCR